jgi:transcriptional regulator with XRE-family HTH domain
VRHGRRWEGVRFLSYATVVRQCGLCAKGISESPTRDLDVAERFGVARTHGYDDERPSDRAVHAGPSDRRGRTAEPLGAEATLGQLRESRGLSQLALGQKLCIKQASVCKVERGTDVHLSTLRRYIEAMGGKLEIIARRTVPGRPKVLIGEEATLRQLRDACGRSQVALGKKLGINGPWVSKLERGTDLRLSSLRRYIEGLVGKLEIVARFPDRTVRIKQFNALDRDERLVSRAPRSDEAIGTNPSRTVSG